MSDLDLGAPKPGKQEVELTVLTLPGEAALPLTRVPADLTVAELLARLRRSEEGGGRAPELLSLLLGSRPLAALERLGDLEAPAPADGAPAALALTLVRQPVDGEALERVRGRVGVRGTVLSLERQDLGDAEVIAVAYLLQEPACALETVSLSRSNVADITPVAEALLVNTSLLRLNLASSAVKDISALAEALRVNSTLRDVDFRRTEIQNLGCLADALRVNRGLESLNFQNCTLPVEVERELTAVRAEMKDANKGLYLWMGSKVVA